MTSFLSKILKQNLELADFSNNQIAELFFNEYNFESIFNIFKCNIEEKFHISSKDFAEFWDILLKELIFFKKFYKKLQTPKNNVKSISRTNSESLHFLYNKYVIIIIS